MEEQQRYLTTSALLHWLCFVIHCLLQKTIDFICGVGGCNNVSGPHLTRPNMTWCTPDHSETSLFRHLTGALLSASGAWGQPSPGTHIRKMNDADSCDSCDGPRRLLQARPPLARLGRQESRARLLGSALIQPPQRPGESRGQDTTHRHRVTVWRHGVRGQEEEVSGGGGGGQWGGGGGRGDEEEEAGDVRERDGVPLQQAAGSHLCAQSGERTEDVKSRDVTQALLFSKRDMYICFK